MKTKSIFSFLFKRKTLNARLLKKYRNQANNKYTISEALDDNLKRIYKVVEIIFYNYNDYDAYYDTNTIFKTYNKNEADRLLKQLLYIYVKLKVKEKKEKLKRK